MNIRKHLQRLFLASTALFWASCGDDANSSSPTVAPETNIPSDSAETIVPSDPLQQNETDKVDSIPNESPSPQCHEADKIPKQYISSNILNDPIKAATEAADRNAQMEIHEDIEYNVMAEYDEAFRIPPECLQDMLDTLEALVFAYGTMMPSDSIATKFVCDNGKTYASDDYLNYQKDLEKYQENRAIFNEKYNQLYEKRLAELQKQLDDCISHPEETEED